MQDAPSAPAGATISNGNGCHFRHQAGDVLAHARHRGRDVLTGVAGIPSDLLDKRHHACPKCGGSDRFSLVDADKGAVLCRKCFSTQNGDCIAAVCWALGIEWGEAIDRVGDYLGLTPQNGETNASDPLDAVCRAKRMPKGSALAYGATVVDGGVQFPMFGHNGYQCSEFTIWPTGGAKRQKGLCAAGKPAGVFLPADDGKAKLPQPGETWIVVEGVKDAAALAGMGCLAMGLPTCSMAQKFAKLLRGVNVVLIPDRDAASVNGMDKSARRLIGVASKIEIAALPAEVADKDGKDVRDILAQENGEQLVREAIEQAQPFIVESEGSEPSRPTIKFRVGISTVADVLRQVTDVLIESSDLYTRTGQLVVLHNGHLFAITKATELAGILSRRVEFAYSMGDQINYEPLPAKYANTWLNNFDELARLPAINVYSRNPMFTQGFRLVAPGFDKDSGIYYAGPAITPNKGEPVRLNALLADFCWKSPSDRANYVGILLTALLMSKFIGSHPAALFNGNQPELGKSILAQIAAILRSGEPAPTCSYNARNDEEFEKTLGSRIKEGATDLIIDNAKDKGGRSAVIDSQVLERSITDAVLNYRLLGTSSSIRCENSVQFYITANGAECSRDLVTRSCPINLHYEGDPARRRFTLADPEGFTQEHRLELLAELCGMVERWKAAGMPLANVNSRFNKKGWGNIVGGILTTCGEVGFLENADEVACDMDTVRREFGELVQAMFDDARGSWTGSELVDLAARCKVLVGMLGDLSPRSQATRLGKLATRFIGERFAVGDAKTARFYRDDERRITEYFVRDVTEGGDDAF